MGHAADHPANLDRRWRWLTDLTTGGGFLSMSPSEPAFRAVAGRADQQPQPGVERSVDVWLLRVVWPCFVQADAGPWQVEDGSASARSSSRTSAAQRFTFSWFISSSHSFVNPALFTDRNYLGPMFSCSCLGWLLFATWRAAPPCCRTRSIIPSSPRGWDGAARGRH